MPVKSFEKRKSNVLNSKKKEEDNQVRDSALNDLEEHYQTLIKPVDQLILTDQELKEEITKVLKATNPAAPDNIVRYSFRERQYKQVANIDQTMYHYSMYSNLVPKDSFDLFELKKAMVSFDDNASLANSNPDNENETHSIERENTAAMSHSSTMFNHDMEATQNESETMKSSNKFLFCTRATQTLNDPHQSKTTQSELPPRGVFCEYVNQAIIFDWYEKDYAQYGSKHKRILTNFDGSRLRLIPKRRTFSVTNETHFDDVTIIMPAIKILERMLNLNTFDEIAHDFRYYEDPADEYRTDGHGTLLPLWKFSYEKSKKRAVTSLVWSPDYKDLFFAGYGNYSITSFQEEGLICGFSLKNPGYPEYILTTKSPVISIDIHPTDGRLLCAGMVDGSVIVISLLERNSTKKPSVRHASNLHSQKHRDPCWQVKWLPTDKDNVYAFISVSEDGRVSKWTLNKYELLCEDILILNHLQIPKDIPGMLDKCLESGSSLALHPSRNETFLVGTHEGNIYNSMIMQTTISGSSSHHHFNQAMHNLIIYRLAWSPWHPDIFASCSADWTVRIWNFLCSDPVISFDLGAPVSDFAWAPYSSTVFGAITTDRKVRIYDLSINRLDPLVCQIVGSQKRNAALTQISFNNKYPIILVGDTRGLIHSMKLSPNLRKCPKVKRGETIDVRDYEFNKLEKIIQLVS